MRRPILLEPSGTCEQVLMQMPAATLAIRRTAFRSLASGQTLTIDEAARVTDLDPETAREAAELVASVGMAEVGWLPQVACSNVMAEFCPSALLFCSSDHLETWRSDTDAGVGEDDRGWARRARPDRVAGSRRVSGRFRHAVRSAFSSCSFVGD